MMAVSLRRLPSRRISQHLQSTSARLFGAVATTFNHDGYYRRSRRSAPWRWSGSAAAAATAALGLTVTSTTTIALCDEADNEDEEDSWARKDVLLKQEPLMEHILSKPDRELLMDGGGGWLAKVKNLFRRNQPDKITVQNDDDGPDVNKIPSDDEPTDCFLCQTYRVGPCRDVWREFEFCVANMDGQRDTGQCDRFVKPFEECATQHERLYKLVALDVHQTPVRNMELDYRYDSKGKLNAPIDWTGWTNFLKEEGSLQKAEADCSAWQSLDKFVPLWKRFGILEKQPFILTVKTTVPTRNDGKVLSAVYALDQDGLVVGYVNFDARREAAAKQGKHNMPDNQDMEITLAPGMTKTVQVKAMYSENASTHPTKKGWEYDSTLYVAPEVKLEAVAQKVVPLQK